MSHLRDDAGAPDGGTVRDAGDASVPRDAPLRVDAFPLPDAGSCGGGGGVVVRVEPVTRETMRCFVGHAEGVAVLGVDAAPDDFGIRIHADLCPDADADCRCDFVVANVGIGLADEVLIPARNNIFDINERHLSIRQEPTCECLGCPCSYALVLDAADDLFDARFGAELMLSAGTRVCPEISSVMPGAWFLRVSSLGMETEVPHGRRGELGVVHIESVRDVDIYGPGGACAMCGSPQASWVAWVRH